MNRHTWTTLTAPGYQLCLWTIAAGWLGGWGFVIGDFAAPFWAATAAIVIAFALRTRLSGITALLVPLLSTVVVMLPWLWHGISTYPGSGVWDGWPYVAFGETIREHSRFAIAPPDATPMYELGFALLHTRFITASLLALFSGVLPPGGDTQAAVGFLLFVYVFAFASSIGALGLVLFPGSRPVRVGYIIAATVSGFVITMLHANNYDQLLAQTVVPLAAGLAFRLEWGNWKSAAALGVVCAALVLIYPELSPATVGISALILMWRLWIERPPPRSVAITVALGLLVLAVCVAPAASDLLQYSKEVVFLATATPLRPGEGYFPAFYQLRCTFGSFAMLYAPFTLCGHSFMSILTEFVGALLFVAACAGVLLARGRFVAVAFSTVIPFVAACIITFMLKYDYGGYKLLTIGFPFALALALNAVAAIRAQWLKIAAVAALIANAIIIGFRIQELDNAARQKSVNVWKVQGIPPGSVVALKVKDDLAFRWAAYYLRNHPIVPVIGHLIYLPKPQAKQPTEPPTYLVSDQPQDSCWGAPVWSSAAFKVFRIVRPTDGLKCDA
jgi:hypothetical protein